MFFVTRVLLLLPSTVLAMRMGEVPHTVPEATVQDLEKIPEASVDHEQPEVVLSREVCKALTSDGNDPHWLKRGPDLGTDQISSLCDSAWKPLNAGTKGGSDLFKTGDGRLIIKQMHRHEEDSIAGMLATEGLGGDGSFITTFYADFHLLDSPWGIMPNIFTDGNYRLYDLKGVTTAKYFKKKSPYRDPNWVSDYIHSGLGGQHAFVGVPADAYLKLVPQLAQDVDLLSRYGAVDYSMLAAVYSSSSDGGGLLNVGKTSVAGKKVLPSFDFKHNTSQAILLAGLVDFLEWSFTPRRPKGPETDIARTFYYDAKAYACRIFWFITTQMLTPCSDVEQGRGCVKDFGPLLEKVFEPISKTPPVNDGLMVTGCKNWKQHYMSIASVVPQIEAFVQQQLE